MNRLEYNERLYSSQYYQNYLAHHGIIGQKWGVRRFQNKDGSLTAEGKKRYLKNVFSKDDKKQSEKIKRWNQTNHQNLLFMQTVNLHNRLFNDAVNQMHFQNHMSFGGKKQNNDGKEQYNKDNVDHSKSEDYKQAAKNAIWGSAALTALSAGVAAASVLASGGTSILLYPVVSTGAGIITTAALTGKFLVKNHQAKKGEKLKKKIDEERETEKVDKKTGLHVYDDDDTRTLEEKMERVNPEYHNWDRNTENNCVLCSIAMELQNRGYDVSANKASDGYTEDVFKRWFKNTERKNVDGSLSDMEMYNRYVKILTMPSMASAYKMSKADSKKVVDNFINELKTQTNSSGMFDVTWNGTTSGHEMFYKVENGEVTIYDAQCNEKMETKDLYGKVWGIGYNRLDDKQIISKNIKEAVN